MTSIRVKQGSVTKKPFY